MTILTQALNGTVTPQASLNNLRWYMGTFKEISQGTFRAVSRALNNMLTKNRDL